MVLKLIWCTYIGATVAGGWQSQYSTISTKAICASASLSLSLLSSSVLTVSMMRSLLYKYLRRLLILSRLHIATENRAYKFPSSLFWLFRMRARGEHLSTQPHTHMSPANILCVRAQAVSALIVQFSRAHIKHNGAGMCAAWAAGREERRHFYRATSTQCAHTLIGNNIK